MAEEILYESERDASASDAAASLRRIADALERDADLAFGGDVVVPVPAELEFEIELELEWEVEGDEADDAGATEDDSEADTEPAGAEASTDADAAEPVPEEPAPEGAVDLTVPAESQATFEVYRDRAEEWRWRLRHRNGEIVADSGEGYGRLATLENGLESVKRNAPGAPVEYPED